MIRVDGDFNLPDINWNNSSAASSTQNSNISNQLIEISQDHGLTQIVNKPTRSTPETENILDLFFSNQPDMINRHDVIPGLSDHDIPLLDISTRISLNKKKPRRVYQYKKGNMEGLVSDLSDFSDTFCNNHSNSSSFNINNMWNELKEEILKVMDKHIPSKMLSSSKHLAPWISMQIKHEIRKRDRLYSKAKTSNEDTDWERFKLQKRKVQSTIRKSYWNHVENNILINDEQNFGETQKKFWKHVKSLKKDRTGTAPLKDNGLLYSDAKSKADILNRQYQSVFSHEDLNNIPEPDDIERPAMSEITVGEEGVFKMLSKVKENKASGPDQLPSKILKIAAKPLSRCLTLIFNASLVSGTLPQDWCTANITPVFKKGERFKAANYRPVSLTCICSKLLEHIIVSQVMDHFDEYSILSDCQHGFRSRLSCETQLISLTQELHERLEEKSQVDMTVLDFSKAFDKVPHQRLMRKLWRYGVRGQTHSWIEAFLTNRRQRVVVDGECSEWVSVDSGVPQGTVLGPLLFLTFINDLPKAVRNSKVRLFADDCVVYRKVASESDCDLLQDDLQHLENWENTWLMSFNASKCNSISITRKKKKIHHSYTLHNQILEHVPSTRYLGVDISSDLTWKNHIDRTCAKANRQLAFLRRNLQIQNTKVKASAYLGLVRPITEYCSTVWDPHHQKYKDHLEAVQRRAARFVHNTYQRIAPVTEMINRLGWEDLETRRLKARLTMFFKIKHNLVAIPLPDFIAHPLRTTPRLPSEFGNLFAGTEAYRNSFYVKTLRTWNLHPSFYSLDSLPSFKDAMDSYSA